MKCNENAMQLFFAVSFAHTAPLVYFFFKPLINLAPFWPCLPAALLNMCIFPGHPIMHQMLVNLFEGVDLIKARRRTLLI